MVCISGGFKSKNQMSMSLLQNYAAQANFYDLGELITSLQNICKEEDKCEHPVRKAAFNDDVKLMEFLLTTSYDMNSEIWFGQTAFHVACDYGSKKVAKLIMESSGKYGIGNVNNLSI